MYGLFEGIDLHVGGAELNQICLGKYDVQFNFDSGTSIGVQGRVNVLDAGTVLSTWEANAGWSSLEFQRLLNSTVTECYVESLTLLVISLAGGLDVDLFDSSDQYETMQISLSDGRLIVV
jgi:hypothetical protein